MSFWFRKSVNVGPFRLNFSRSGIGVSAGIKGARVSAGPRGTYVHVGSNGFHYSQRVGGVRPRQSPQRPLAASTFHIETADVSQLTETSIAELLSQINERAARRAVAPFAVVGTLFAVMFVWIVVAVVTPPLASLIAPDSAEALAMFFGFTSAFLVGIAGGTFSWLVHKGDQMERTSPLFYELDTKATTRFGEIIDSCRTLAHASQVWRVQSNQPTWDWKRNAGASSLITRQKIYVRPQSPPFIATNVEVWAIDLQTLTFFFMPDYIFVRQGNKYGAVSYESLRVTFETTRFIEDLGVPSDARVIEYTWRYVNKSGGPDRRFSNNRRIPIAEYGFLQFVSSTGLNIHLNVSNVGIASSFASTFAPAGSRSTRDDSAGRANDKQSGRSGKESRSEQRYQHPSAGSGNQSWQQPYIDPKIKLACETLGVSINSSHEEIVSSYRNMAKMYHPDKLSNMAPEFVELAEERMKDINAAYEVLKKR